MKHTIRATGPGRRGRCRTKLKHAVSEGFTLTEVMLSTLLVGTVVVASSWAMNTATRAKIMNVEQPFEAAILAKEIYALAQTLPREPSGIPGVRSAGEVVALDSLAGAVFSPPIRADRTTDTSLTGWTQQIQIDIYSMDDLENKTNENILLGVDSKAERLFKIQVTILNQGNLVDSFEWWLTP